MTKQDKKEEFPLKEIVRNIRTFTNYYFNNKLLIIVIVIGGSALGFVASQLYHPKYIASLSFAIEDSETAGGISGLASQFGISLGAGSGGAFGGDNLYELFGSNYIIRKVLLSPIQIDGHTDNLMSLYFRSYGLYEKYATDKKKEVREVRFDPEYVKGNLSRVQDSIINEVHQVVIKRMMTAEKRSKKLNIGDVSFTSRNEMLSKLFVELLIKYTSDFYIDTKTKVSRTNYLLLKQQTDSVKKAYDNALSARASIADNMMNLVKQSSMVGLMKKQTDIQVSMNAYIEMKKNMEMLKYSLSKETPLIQIIDKPILPLKKLEIKWYIGLLVGTLFGLFSSITLALLLYFKEQIMQKIRN
ncbi:MAG: hypothetical protein PHV20_03030 [Bacteroidales bacterium]|nr:hypothetical protein [Bacteroidales bacterium]